MYFQKLTLLLITLLQRPNKYFLFLVKNLYKFMAIAIAVFFSDILYLLPGAIAEAYAGGVAPELVLVTFSYLLLIFSASLACWKIVGQCTIQLKNRFGIEP